MPTKYKSNGAASANSDESGSKKAKSRNDS